MAVKKPNDMAPRPTQKAPTTAGDVFHSNRQSDYTTKFTVQLDTELHRKLKLAAALEESTMREITEDALAHYLNTTKSARP